MEPVPLGPRPQAGEARHGCWEESPLPGMRPTGRWDRSRLKGEKGPLGAVGAPEPSLCAGSLSASPPRARSPPGARSPHARCATAMAPTACSRAGYYDAQWTVSPWEGALWEGAYCRGRGALGPVAAAGHPEGVFPVAGPPGFPAARPPSFARVPLRGISPWNLRQCEATSQGNGATATRLAWGGSERGQCHVGVLTVRNPARRRKK